MGQVVESDRLEYLLRESKKDVDFYRDIALRHLEKIRLEIEMLIDYIEGRGGG